jgi:hypothetical protein
LLGGVTRVGACWAVWFVDIVGLLSECRFGTYIVWQARHARTGAMAWFHWDLPAHAHLRLFSKYVRDPAIATHWACVARSVLHICGAIVLPCNSFALTSPFRRVGCGCMFQVRPTRGAKASVAVPTAMSLWVPILNRNMRIAASSEMATEERDLSSVRMCHRGSSASAGDVPAPWVRPRWRLRQF